MSDKGLVIVSHNNGPCEVRGRVRMQRRSCPALASIPSGDRYRPPRGRDGGPLPDRPASSLTRKRGSEVGHVSHFVHDLKEVTVRWRRLS